MRRRVACLVLALAGSVGCATPTMLVQRSQLALDKGDDRKAWSLAAKALDRDPAFGPAQYAANIAAGNIVTDWRQRIRNLAEADSIGAARQCLSLRDFVAEVARYDVPLPADSLFAFEQRALLHAAAMAYAVRGDANLDSGHPKHAYSDFLEARGFDSGVSGLEDRLDEAYEAARTVVAILPFQDATRVPGLARALAATHQDRVTGGESFRFIDFVPLATIEERLTLAEFDRGSPEELARLARGMGAAWYVTGHLDDFRADTRSDAVHTLLFHKTARRDTSGRDRVAYRPIPFDAIVRERAVWVRWEFEVRRARDASVIAQRGGNVHLRARTFFTSFAPDGDCDDYLLAPPDGHRLSEYNADGAEERWTGWFGGWDVSELLECARTGHDRRRYRPGLLREFRRDTHAHPVFLDDLPAADDLARLGLEDTWRDLFGALLSLDANDVEP